MVPESVKEAADAYEAAAKELMRTVRESYPIGTVLKVTMGNAIIKCVVIDYTSVWWHRPDKVLVRNLKTNKIRDFDATSDRFKIQVCPS